MTLVVGRAAGLGVRPVALTRAMGAGIRGGDQEAYGGWRDKGSLAAQFQKPTAVDFFVDPFDRVLG